MTKPTMLTADGAWCWFSDPRAVRHTGRRDRVYAGFVRRNGDIALVALDLDSGDREEVTLHPGLEIDDHDVPSILVLPDGRLLVSWTEHNGLGFSRVSERPEDVTAWEPVRRLPFGDKITYTSPVLVSGEPDRIHVFFRGADWRPTVASSEDLGRTWGRPVPLIDSRGVRNRPYFKIAGNGRDRTDIVLTDGHPGREPTNSLYHLTWSGGLFATTDGRPLGTVDDLPFDRRRITPCYDATRTGARAWIHDLALDADDQPVLVYARYPDPTDHRYHYARWDGTRWQDEELCAAGGWMPRPPDGEPIREPHYSGGLSLDHADPNRVVLSREIDGRFEVEAWHRDAGGWHTRSLTAGSGQDHLRPFVVADRTPGRPPIVCWMAGTYRHYTDYDTALMIMTLE